MVTYWFPKSHESKATSFWKKIMCTVFLGLSGNFFKGIYETRHNNQHRRLLWNTQKVTLSNTKQKACSTDFWSGVCAWQCVTAYHTHNNGTGWFNSLGTIQSFSLQSRFGSQRFPFFLHLKTFLASQKFESDDDEIKGNVQQWLKSQVAKFFEANILKLVSRFEISLNLHGIM